MGGARGAGAWAGRGETAMPGGVGATRTWGTSPSGFLRQYADVVEAIRSGRPPAVSGARWARRRRGHHGGLRIRPDGHGRGARRSAAHEGRRGTRGHHPAPGHGAWRATRSAPRARPACTTRSMRARSVAEGADRHDRRPAWSPTCCQVLPRLQGRCRRRGGSSEPASPASGSSWSGRTPTAARTSTAHRCGGGHRPRGIVEAVVTSPGRRRQEAVAAVGIGRVHGHRRQPATRTVAPWTTGSRSPASMRSDGTSHRHPRQLWLPPHDPRPGQHLVQRRLPGGAVSASSTRPSEA